MELPYGMPESSAEEVFAMFDKGEVIGAWPDYAEYIEDGIKKTRLIPGGYIRYCDDRGYVRAWRRLAS